MCLCRRTEVINPRIVPFRIVDRAASSDCDLSLWSECNRSERIWAPCECGSHANCVLVEYIPINPGTDRTSNLLFTFPSQRLMLDTLLACTHRQTCHDTFRPCLILAGLSGRLFPPQTHGRRSDICERTTRNADPAPTARSKRFARACTNRHQAFGVGVAQLVN